MTKKTLITLILGAIFVIGSGYIVYAKRPIMDLENIEVIENDDSNQEVKKEENGEEEIEEILEEGDEKSETQESEEITENKDVIQETAISEPVVKQVVKPSTSPKKNIFTLQTVAEHNSKIDCWTAINGSVYDLTSFVSQHPGGVSKITKLCGIDGTTFFTNQHGSNKKAQASLGLLKIGQLN